MSGDDHFIKLDNNINATSNALRKLYRNQPLIDQAADTIDRLQTNVRHWREECGKLHAKQKALELDNLQLRSTLTAIRDRLWTDGETYDERIGDLKWLAREVLEQKSL